MAGIEKGQSVLEVYSEQSRKYLRLKHAVNFGLLSVINRARSFVKKQDLKTNDEACYVTTEAENNGQFRVVSYSGVLLRVSYLAPKQNDNVVINWPAMCKFTVKKYKIIENGKEEFRGETNFCFDPNLPETLPSGKNGEVVDTTMAFKDHIALITHCSKGGRVNMSTDYNRVGYYDVQTGMRLIDPPELTNKRAEQVEDQADPLAVAYNILSLLSSATPLSKSLIN